MVDDAIVRDGIIGISMVGAALGLVGVAILALAKRK
jgi:hypothetical protein